MWGRMPSCGGLATRLPVICTAAASQGPIANRPQDAMLNVTYFAECDAKVGRTPWSARGPRAPRFAQPD
jgi:hypothetical protein